MRTFSKKQKLAAAVLGAGVIAVAGGGIAYAFWTTSGSGSATAAAGTDTAVTLTGTTSGAVTPGGATGTVTFTVNNSASGPEYVTQIHLVSVQAFSDPARTTAIPVGTAAADCDTSQFSMANVPVGVDVPTGSTQLTQQGTLVMADDPQNDQEGCKGAYLTLTLSSS